MEYAELYGIIVSCTVQYWTILDYTDYTGLYWTIQDYTGLYWTILDYTTLYWSILVKNLKTLTKV